MKPFNDEINDALRRKLQSSLEDFESKPDAAFDRKMYRLLKKTPAWRSASVWILVGAILFCGVVLLSYEMLLPSEETASRSASSRSKVVKVEGNLSSGKPRKVQAKPQPRVAAIRQERANHPDQNNEKRDAGPLRAERTENVSVTAAGRGAHVPEHSNNKRQARAIDRVTQNGQIAVSGQKPAVVQERVEFVGQEKQESVPEYLPQTVPSDVHNTEITTSMDVRLSGLPGGEFELLVPVSSLHSLHQLTLPAIRYTVTETTASLAKTHQSQARKKHYIDWSEAGKLSFIFNATPYQTIQQVSILARSESRIQDVAFPRAFSTLGYKLGAGAEKDGFQLTANFSRINTQLSYAYASDEYKIVETAPDEYEIQRLANKQYHSRSVNLIGLGVKKQVDFKSRLLGQLYTNIGVEYSRSLSSGSRGFLFANLSSGKRFMLNSSLSVSAGPYFEYCFGKMNAASGQIGIRPSQVGLLLAWKIRQSPE